jgi:hypothetical protein
MQRVRKKSLLFFANVIDFKESFAIYFFIQKIYWSSLLSPSFLSAHPLFKMFHIFEHKKFEFTFGFNGEVMRDFRVTFDSASVKAFQDLLEPLVASNKIGLGTPTSKPLSTSSSTGPTTSASGTVAPSATKDAASSVSATVSSTSAKNTTSSGFMNMPNILVVSLVAMVGGIVLV